MRFDSNESPQNVNDGKGWSEMAAKDWLAALELEHGHCDKEDQYLRFSQYKPGTFIDTEHVERGVMLVLCKPRSE